MKEETRAKYADYIAMCMREATTETGSKWPDDTILCVKTYSELAELDEIVGLKIWVMDMPSSFDFFVAFPSANVDRYKLHNAFRESMECSELELG